VNDLVNTVDAALAGLSGNIDSSDSFVRRSSVMVQKDRMLVGLIDEEYRRAQPGDVSALDEFLRLGLQLARKNRDRFVVQQLADLSRGIDWGLRPLISDEEKLSGIAPFWEQNGNSFKIEGFEIDVARLRCA
jgi:hypothetical protein